MKAPGHTVYNGAANENLFGASPKVTIALQNALNQISSYPTPDAASLREAISRHLPQVQPAQIVVGSGSAELISLLIRAFCLPFGGSNVVSVEPTYPLYQMEAEALGIKFKPAPLNSRYAFDIASLLRKIDSDTRIVFLSNPNNPTGNYLTRPELELLLQEVPPHVTLVLDEAYVEFTNAPDYTDALPYLPQHPNLVVLRTFSKAYGLASLRVGYMVAQEQLLQRILQVKQPYNVNQLAQIAALTALEDTEHLQYTLAETKAGKAHLQQVLEKEGLQWWPSEGNFLFVDAGVPAADLAAQLQQQGILVRNTGSRYNFRITVGKQEHQHHLQQQLKVILSPENVWQEKPLAQILETGYTLAAQASPAQAMAAVDKLAAMASSTGTAAERIALAFARAFSACIGPEGNEHTGNLYSSTYGETDMISAFNVLVKATPLVTFGHLFGNLAIAHATATAQEIHILDLGIGGGLQWLHLLELLASRPGTKPKVRITGIDIPAATGDPEARLRHTGDMLLQHAASLQLDLTYTLRAQRLEETDLQQDVYFSPSETLVVNSALTLHHLPDLLLGEQDFRDFILQQIRGLKPAILTLTEPDSEHNKLHYLPRLRESLRHYYTVFDVLDTLLPPLLPERQVIEQEFFGREIINVISCEESQRVERHERHEAWFNRLVRNGFAPAMAPVPADGLRQALQLHADFELLPNGAGYTLCWKGTPVVAATAWVPEG